MGFSAKKKRLSGGDTGGALGVFLTALVCACCIFVPYMIIDGGYFLFFGDFNVQQIPFYQLCHNAIRNGEIGWSFLTDLGANFIGSYTFYTITSPFFWLTLPFPNSWVPYFMGPLLILKFACAALTAYLFIRRFTRHALSAKLGGLLYAFSGFSVYNIFFNHFHEAIVFFPLLLLAFELLMTENRRGVFALAIAVCAAVNYFFFVSMLVFGIIYFTVRMISHAIKPSARQIFALFFEAILGILLASVILLPSYLAIADNSRVSNIDLGWNSLLFGKESIYANVFTIFFFPPDLPAQPVFFPESNVRWSSLGAWMPVFSMVGVFAYCGAKMGSWIKRIIITCAVFAFVPLLNSSFYLFNNSYYVRWFFMPILIMALCTAMAIEDKAVNWDKGFIQVSAITLAITLIIGFFPQTTDDSIIFGLYANTTEKLFTFRFWMTCFIAIAGLVVLYLLLKLRKNELERFLKVAIICVAVFSIGYSNFFIASGKAHSYTHEDVVDHLIEGELQLEGDPDTFRIDTYDAMDNSAMFLGYSSINAFHSIVPSSVMEFYDYIGYKRDVASRPEEDLYAIRPLLSVKYLINRQSGDDFAADDGSTEMPGYTYLYDDSGFSVYENQNYIGYGFSYDAYMSYDDCDVYEDSERAKLMLKAILLTDEQIEKYGYMYESLIQYYENPENNPALNHEVLAVECQKRNATSATRFETGKNSFCATVERDKETLVFFSIPYDEGWTAYVNGKQVDIEKVNVGFMAVPVKAGSSEIVFEYTTPGLKEGIIISVCSAALLVIYLLTFFFYNKKARFTAIYPEGDELLNNWIEQEEEKNEQA